MTTDPDHRVTLPNDRTSIGAVPRAPWTMRAAINAAVRMTHTVSARG